MKKLPNKYSMERIKFIISILAFVFIISCGEQKNKKLNTEVESISEFIEIDTQRNEYLIAVLDTIDRDEQVPIRLRDELMEKYGVESEEALVQQKIYKKNHIINEKKVASILEEYGWLGEDVIGFEGSVTLCNVIQHSDNEIRIKYLPMMREAVNKGNLQARYLVRAEDRIATEQGELQIYGGQMKYYPETKSFNVWPVYDPTNIDKRRAEIGLGSIAEHLKNRFNFTWNLEEQIKRTAEFEKNKNN